MLESQKYGIRFTADAHMDERSDEDSICILSSLKMLAAHFEGTGRRFFYDSGDIDQHDFNGVKCQDLFGWIVPDSMVSEFEPIWLAGNDDGLESFDYVSIGWRQGADGRPELVIDDGEE